MLEQTPKKLHGEGGRDVDDPGPADARLRIADAQRCG
jgi:hypothetical protein